MTINEIFSFVRAFALNMVNKILKLRCIRIRKN